MPEGDTVWLTAKVLHDALAGQLLTASDFRVPQLATADLTGRTVTVGLNGKTYSGAVQADGTWSGAVGLAPGITAAPDRDGGLVLDGSCAPVLGGSLAKNPRGYCNHGFCQVAYKPAAHGQDAPTKVTLPEA